MIDSDRGYLLSENVSLAGRNTFRVPAKARMMADVQRPEALSELLAIAALGDAPLLVLGEGSNLLFADDFPGLVVCLTGARVAIVRDDGDSAIVRADAGLVWNDLVGWSLSRGLVGLENLALIPGTVGAAPIQNIGAYGVEVAEFIETVEAFDRHCDEIVRIAAGDCDFGYRESRFKREPERWIVTAIELRLPRQRPFRLDYAGVREELAAMGASDPPRASQVAEAIGRIRTRKLPNPMLLGNAGSFFKNPLLPAAQAEALKAANPQLPVYPADDVDQRKLSAAWMIETCGWRGYRDGDAGIAEQHALVLVNHGQATGPQLLDLARRVATSVNDCFGVHLEPEPRILGARFDESAA
ncbi:MAG TPA: UDP-N-acetylmuramate dehydrogenase [Arenimonas sp.]|nr:UDP-N-acetylmuramate dehydrogenase [Arenimonas sp.]